MFQISRERMAAILKAALFYIPVLFVTWCGFVAMVPILGFGRQGQRLAHGWFRLWGKMVLLSIGVRVTVEGMDRFDPKEGAVVVLNHSSWIDIPLVAASLPGQIRFVAKEELRRLPLIGWYIQLAGHFFISRDRKRSAHGTMQRVKTRRAAEHLVVTMFPEGGLSKDGNLRPFHAGAFHLARETGAPIQPVAIIGAREVWPAEARFPLTWGKRVTLRVGELLRIEQGPCENGVCKTLARSVQALFPALLAPRPNAA